MDIRPSVIALTETWLQRDDELLVAIASYTLMSSPRLHRRLHILDHLVYHNICKFKPKDDIFECISIEVVSKNTRNIIISCKYRPPNSNIELFNLQFDTFLFSVKVGKKGIHCSR